ncbi:uncharacterized protein [Typha latifolia]|uniref:uncharacterized protein n=1 Tax=Typha latifolia TaxID=4733 RepID=UPI003C2AFD4C
MEGKQANGTNRRIPEEILEKLREQIEECIIIDPEVLEKCRSRWKLTLFGRFLGRSIPLEMLKRTLIRLWNGIDKFAASDMSGEPTAEAFTSALVWIQLHNLPQEYWELEALVPVAEYFGKPLRVDETTLDHTRSKVCRVCVEIDLQKPLKKAVWLGPKEDWVDLRVVYENIPVFCYLCGKIGHRAAGCEHRKEEARKEGTAQAKCEQTPTEEETMQPPMTEQT